MALKVAATQTRLRQDIAERMRAAEALRVSEASYRAIFDAAEDAIFVHHIETGAIVDVNPKACTSFGYTREEFRQLDIGSLGTGEQPYRQQDAMALIARAAAGEELRIEWHGRSKDGVLRWHEVFIKRVTIGGVEEPHRAVGLRLTIPFSALGGPGLSVPCGFSADGLPIGLQIAGRRWDEPTVLRVGHAYEQATDWHRRRPPLA